MSRQRRNKSNISLGLERAKLLEVEQRKHQASLWSACCLQHEAISHTLIHIRDQCNASRNMQEREAKMAYERIIRSESCSREQTGRTSASEKSFHLDDSETPDQLITNLQEDVGKDAHSSSTDTGAPEFEQFVLEYMEANKGLASQRLRLVLF